MKNTQNFKDLSSVQEYYRDALLIEDESAFTCFSQEYNTNVAVDSVDVIELDEHIIIGCLQHDSDPTEFWDDDSPLTLFTRENHQATLKAAKKGGKLFYIVDKYQHGNVHYSVSASSDYPDAQFDVSHGCGVYVPYEYTQKQYKKMKKEVGEMEAFKHFVPEVNKVLSSYSDWCNGEVYGYNVVVYDKTGKVVNEDNQTWGYVGYDNAQKEKLEVMESLRSNLICEALAKNVITEHKTLEQLKDLKLKIDVEGAQEITYTNVYNKHIVAVNYTTENKAAVYEFTDGIKKPSVGQFGEWQIRHNVKKEDFLKARMRSNILQVIRENIDNEPHQAKSLSL